MNFYWTNGLKIVYDFLNIITFTFIVIFQPGTQYHKTIFSSARMHLFNQKWMIKNIFFEFKITVLYFNIFQNVIYYITFIQSSVSHDPSEIILICWFAAQENVSFIINVENRNYAFSSGFI